MHTYTYNISELLKRIQYESLKKAENTKDDSGKSLVDSVGVNDEDFDFYRRVPLRNAANKVFEFLAPYANVLLSLDEPLAGMEYDVVSGEITNAIIFRVEWPEKFDLNNVNSILDCIENILVTFSLIEYYKKSRIDYRQEKEELEGYLDSFRTLLLRRIGYKIPYKYY